MAIIEQRWDDLLELQAQQDKMLKALFSVANVSFSEQEQEDLLEVQRLNQEVIAAVQEHKAELGSQLRGLQQGKSKVGAYRSS